MEVTDKDIAFDFPDLDYYYDWTVEDDGEDIPHGIAALLDIEIDHLIKEQIA